MDNQWTEPDRRKYWKNKYLSDHKIHFAVSFVFSAGLVLLLRWRALVELSDLGWVAIFLILIVWDLFHFSRQMNDYVRIHLAEEEANGTAKDGYSTIDPNDPRIVDVSEVSEEDSVRKAAEGGVSEALGEPGGQIAD